MSGIGAKVLSLYLAYRRPFVLAAVGLFIAWIGFGEIVAAHDVYDGLCNVSAPRTQCPGMGTSGLGLITGLAAITVPYAIARFLDRL
jgi:hypothetical protein